MTDLKAVRQYLISQYKYDPGEYEGYDFKTDNKKFLAARGLEYHQQTPSDIALSAI